MSTHPTAAFQLRRTLTCAGLASVLACALSGAEPSTPPAISVTLGPGGQLAYASDPAGNRVIDFSHAGYEGGGEPVPWVAPRIRVEPDGGHDRERIQRAIDLVAAMPAGRDGFRGAVLLAKGRYVIDADLRISASGIVLRGSGEDEAGTVLVAAGQSRRTLIVVSGRGERTELTERRRQITDPYVPVGSIRFTLDDAGGLTVGTRVVIRRPSTAEWISRIGMDTFTGWRPTGRIQWGPGSRDVVWDRVVTAIDGTTITLDAPITTALDAALGGGTVTPYEFAGRIDRVGVENLSCVSEFARASPTDEEHAWDCIALDKVEDAWVRQVTARHFAGSIVNVGSDARSITVEDCTALEPVSELAGHRRRVFSIGGQLTLVQRCRSEGGLHDFTTGFGAAGSNVFLHCTAVDARSWSGPVESWASGVLYDNVIIRGNALRFMNRGANGQGAGWTTANSVLWNCESTELQVQSPPDTSNQAYGCKGLIVDDSLDYDPRIMPYRGFVRGSAVAPASLYLAQLGERKGADSVARIARVPVSIDPSAARILTNADLPPPPPSPVVHPLRVANGRFTIDGAPAWTAATRWSWYLGQMPRHLAQRHGPAITRFAPGATGTGLTDVLEDVVEGMAPGSVFVQHYGLWYDRRRINHNFYGSPELPADDVSAPFMEMPWARSGRGTDWNGMSKYDLTRFNPWYFQRVKDFADLCDTRGRILQFNFYFQHALQETRAHYVDFPWRPVNCLQATDMPDENPAGSTFYDVSHPVRRDLHRLYIRHCLDVLKDNANVVYGIDREYSGPLSFVEFWLDTIAQWEAENGRKVFIALEVPKDQMDAILADPKRGPMITAIGFHFWSYRADGSLFAIEGGLNLAPREQLQQALSRLQSAGAPGPVQNYRALREYRDAWPDRVVINAKDDFPELTAAIETAIPAAERAKTRPAGSTAEPTTSWIMAAPGTAYLVYSMEGKPVDLDLAKDAGEYTLSWIASSGSASANDRPLAAGRVARLVPPDDAAGKPCAAWLQRK